MPTLSATVQTDQPERYILRLSKHWAHKFPVTFDSQRSRIDLDDSICELVAEDGSLRVILKTPEGSVDELQAVIAEHLQRFAPRDTKLIFTWCSTPESDA
ncbi:DUF2218 domain-containing protein [Pseudomonas sp. SC11]|uniref:DUF2218 domain-containing protein n=1 Tax=Pseudomonas sp. SC11 TaxID=326927 RepID=UPI00399BC788